MCFGYQPVDLSAVRTVEIVPIDDPGYQDYMESIYNSSGADSTYKQWADEHPDLARRFRKLAEDAIADPDLLADELDQRIYNGRHDALRDHGGDLRYVVRYPDHIDKCERHGIRGIEPYDEDSGAYTDRTVHRTTFGLIDKLRGAEGEEKQRKACLTFAFSETFETSDRVDSGSFNPLREEALLDHMQSEAAADEAAEVGTGGHDFEQEVRDRLDDAGLPLRDPVFRIEQDVGDIRYKVMDVHTRVGNTPIILELFTDRIASRKREQLDNYQELYRAATGFDPDGYLVTDQVWLEDESDSVGRDGEMTPDHFLTHVLPENYDYQPPAARSAE